MDGPAGLNQEPIEPGESFTYEFVASQPEHAGITPIRMCRHRSPSVCTVRLSSIPEIGGHTYDRDYTYVLSEWDADLTPNVALGIDPPSERDCRVAWRGVGR